MTESSYYARITAYYVRNARETIFWESKFTRNSRIPFNAVAPHQEENLLKDVFGHKIADSGVSRKPADGFVLYHPKSIIVAIYYAPGDTEVYEIGIRAFVNEKYSSKEKSLSKMRASQIGLRIYL